MYTLNILFLSKSKRLNTFKNVRERRTKVLELEFK